MAKVVRVHQLGGPEVMQMEELQVGAPGKGEARIRVEAIGLNRSEAMFRAGHYPQKPKLPTLMGYEGVGTIEALGEGVTGFKVGERVCVLPSFHQGEYGVYGEQAIVPARSLLAAPPNLSVVEAASIWMQYFTAYGIFEAGHLGIGDYVILPAASSSVGLAAIQLANWAGATPIAVTRTNAKAAALKEQGAPHVIASEETDLAAEVMRITNGRGAKVVFDPVGGPGVPKLADAMAENGTLIIYGGLSLQPVAYPHWQSAFKGISVRSWIASMIWGKHERMGPVKDTILRGLASGKLKPVISKTFPLAQIVEAHRYLESNQQLGKIVVTV